MWREDVCAITIVWITKEEEKISISMHKRCDFRITVAWNFFLTVTDNDWMNVYCEEAHNNAKAYAFFN